MIGTYLYTKLVLPFFQAVAGLLADARSLADIAREEASNFRSNFGYNLPLKHLAESGHVYTCIYTVQCC